MASSLSFSLQQRRRRQRWRAPSGSQLLAATLVAKAAAVFAIIIVIVVAAPVAATESASDKLEPEKYAKHDAMVEGYKTQWASDSTHHLRHVDANSISGADSENKKNNDEHADKVKQAKAEKKDPPAAPGKLVGEHAYELQEARVDFHGPILKHFLESANPRDDAHKAAKDNLVPFDDKANGLKNHIFGAKEPKITATKENAEKLVDYLKPQGPGYQARSTTAKALGDVAKQIPAALQSYTPPDSIKDAWGKVTSDDRFKDRMQKADKMKSDITNPKCFDEMCKQLQSGKQSDGSCHLRRRAMAAAASTSNPRARVKLYRRAAAAAATCALPPFKEGETAKKDAAKAVTQGGAGGAGRTKKASGRGGKGVGGKWTGGAGKKPGKAKTQAAKQRGSRAASSGKKGNAGGRLAGKQTGSGKSLGKAKTPAKQLGPKAAGSGKNGSAAGPGRPGKKRSSPAAKKSSSQAARGQGRTGNGTGKKGGKAAQPRRTGAGRKPNGGGGGGGKGAGGKTSSTGSRKAPPPPRSRKAPPPPKSRGAAKPAKAGPGRLRQSLPKGNGPRGFERRSRV
ncbi:hypothetical protein DFJ73DRAFT_792924 [Zopfochytrium polystomum]|nr:hypothetical protein DFJ73DRAFT_792924 [Zopfochytrium polystomum]